MEKMELTYNNRTITQNISTLLPILTSLHTPPFSYIYTTKPSNHYQKTIYQPTARTVIAKTTF